MRRGGRDRSGGLELKDPISVARLIGRFAIAGVVVLALVSALTALASRRIGTDQAIADAQRVTYITGKGIIEPLLDQRLMEHDRDALEHLDRAVRDTLLEGSLVRIKVWSRDGVVVYSDESRLIGEQFALEADALEVLATGEAHADVSDLASDENQFETESKLLEVYQRLETSTGEPVLYEAYFRYSGVAAVGRKLWTQFAPIAIGALVLLQLVQIPLAWSMARRLRSGQLERERLLRHAIDASDNERRRIAGDLHDGVVQELTGVSLGLAALGRAADIPRTQVLEASSAIRNSIKSLRSLLVEIYPPNLHEEGLESAVSDLLSGLASAVSPPSSRSIWAGAACRAMSPRSSIERRKRRSATCQRIRTPEASASTSASATIIMCGSPSMTTAADSRLSSWPIEGRRDTWDCVHWQTWSRTWVARWRPVPSRGRARACSSTSP